MQQHAEHAKHNGQTTPAPAWLTIAEAAAALGVSVDTVRRRLKRGELQAEQVHTERGPVWRVALDSVPSMPSTPGSNGHSTLGTPGSSADEHAAHAVHDQQLGPLLKALELLEHAQAEVVAKAEAAAMWQARAELLGMQLQQSQEHIRALEAPPEPDPSEIALQRDSEGVTAETTQMPPEPKRRAWWRLW